MNKNTRSEYNYFEVCIGKGPKEDPTNDTWLCIKANSLIVPSIEILTDFLKSDLNKRPSEKIPGFCAIDESEAKDCYDFTNESRWPILGGEIQTNLFE